MWLRLIKLLSPPSDTGTYRYLYVNQYRGHKVPEHFTYSMFYTWYAAKAHAKCSKRFVKTHYVAIQPKEV